MKNFFKIMMYVIIALFVLGMGAIIISRLIFLTEKNMSTSSFLSTFEETGSGRLLSLKYTGVKTGFKAPQPIDGEDLRIIVNSIDGSSENFTFEGEIEAFDEVKIPYDEDSIFFTIYYKGEKLK